MSGYQPRPYDRVELAKSGRSECKLCHNKIAKDTLRVAIHTRNGIYWGCRFYHEECVKSTEQGIELMNNANFKKPTRKRKDASMSQAELLGMEVATFRKKQRILGDTIKARGDLREVLRKVRLRIAHHCDQPAYMIFHDTALDSLVEKLPCDMTELMDVYGFGPRNSQSLGPMLLPIIRDYKSKMSGNTNTSSSKTNVPPSPNSVTKLKRSDEEDEVFFECQSSVDDLIQRKIKEAEERGEVIELEL